MSSDLHFSIQAPSLKLIYDVLALHPVPSCLPHYFSVQQVETKDDGHDVHSITLGVQMQARLHVAPFAPDWERMELWGRNCGRRGDGGPDIAVGDRYGYEILHDFEPCKVYVPRTSDPNVFENVMIWWQFPCPRPGGGAPIYAEQVVFLFDAKCRESEG
jgi:hypothetical protein